MLNLGDYILHDQIRAQDGRNVYMAEQQGTNRRVILELIQQSESTPDAINSFLEDLRAKTYASENLPFLDTVFEAQKIDDYIFYTYQQASGINLAQLIEQSTTLPTDTIAHIIDAIATASQGFEQLGIMTRPWTLSDITIRETGQIDVANIAIAGTPSLEVTSHTMEQIAQLFAPLITDATPGATRLHTLAKWMQEGVNDAPLTWEQLEELISLLREQLGLINPTITTALTTKAPSNNKKRIAIIALAALILLAITTYLIVDNTKNPGVSGEATSSTTLSSMTRRPILSQRDHTDILITLPNSQKPIACDAHEVTIGAYARFLQSLTRLPQQIIQKNYRHPDQPEGKTSYQPNDWDNILAAAQAGKSWQGLPLTLTSPVFNIDWWDAQAYAKWKGRRLPTKDEWLAIAHLAKTDEKHDPYTSVENYDEDLGEHNLCGFSSGLSEWTSTTQLDPSQPLEPPLPIICGGHYQDPSTQAVRWASSPNMRSLTVGFRTISTPQTNNSN